MKARRVLATVGLTVGMMAASSAVAEAASPPPFGFWVTPDGGEQLLVTEQAQCSLGDGAGNITTSGQCSWNASDGGGILTITSDQLYRPGPVYFSTSTWSG
jgi:hypothetical protein